MLKQALTKFLAIALLCCSYLLANAEKRVALVIGNSQYTNVPVLANPKNDAVDITQKLNGLGFQTLGGIDLTREAMQSQLREFSKASANADIALFFYAGHGVQVDGINYALPIDSKLEAQVDLGFEALSLDVVLTNMEQNAKTSILFLDACRDNPMAKNLARSMGTRSSAVGRGLAEVGTSVGSLIVFATQPGNVALDGNGRNSPFTSALLQHLGTNADGISGEMILVRRDVIAATSGKQVPWDSSSLTGKVVLGTNAAITDRATKAREAEADEAAAWATIKSTTDVSAVEAFLKQYPDGSFANIAMLRLDSLKLALVQPPKVEVVTPPATIAEEPGTPARSLKELFVDGLARKVTVSELPANSSEKLKLAVSKLSNHEIKIGTFRKNTYLAVLSWSMSWTDARALAESAGGHLLTIADKQENQFAYDLFKPEERFVFTNEDGKDIMGPLMGLYQPQGSKEPSGGWRWVTDEPLTFKFWNRHQPNNFGGKSNVAIFYSYGTRSPKDEQRPIRWDDFEDEGGSQGFIMELENTQ